MPMLFCSRCREVRPDVARPGGYCRSCNASYMRQYRLERRELADPDKERARLEHMYRIACRIGELLQGNVREGSGRETPDGLLNASRRKGAPPKVNTLAIGAALLELRAFCVKRGEWGRELQYLGLSRSRAKYYMDRARSQAGTGGVS